MSGNAKRKKKKPAIKPTAKKRTVAGSARKKAAVAKRKTSKQSRPRPVKAAVRGATLDQHKKQIGTILKKAIKGEEDGLHFYSLLAEKATNVEAKRKLEGLRDDEVRHKVTLVAPGGQVTP